MADIFHFSDIAFTTGIIVVVFVLFQIFWPFFISVSEPTLLFGTCVVWHFLIV